MITHKTQSKLVISLKENTLENESVFKKILPVSTFMDLLTVVKIALEVLAQTLLEQQGKRYNWIVGRS